ncbi:alginate export family protein [Variovorax sp. Varisp85]|uniref:alginate export family protein n=1 Tax=Variovorax sp. Varisp85 TaxID=3243059 RepID=UPI001AEB58B6
MRPIRSLPFISLTALCMLTPAAHGYELYAESETTLNAELKAGYGMFGTRRNYVGRPGGFRWQEGFAKYGLNGSTDRIGSGTLYGALSAISTATWGDGDPGGITTGREHRTRFEDAYVGWKSGDLLPALGKDGIDFSAGRQVVKAGSGFLVNDDGVNPGKGLADGRYDRGGAYYFGQRLAFARTAVLRLGGTEGLHGSAMWLKSNTRLQANTEIAVGTLDYTAPEGTVGFTFIRGLDVDERYAISPTRLERKGMKIYSIRADGNAGIPDADFAFEYAYQKKRSRNDNAWYAEAGYTFSDVAWQPSLSYRYTRYSKEFDSLFQGGFRGRYQGEVASNYAFSYNFNTRIHDVALTVRPLESLAATLMFFDFRTLADRSTLNLDARELALYLDWTITKNLTFSPIIGIYKPRKYEANGGNQSGSAKANPYLKLMLVASF